MSHRFTILVCRGPECGDRRESAAVYTAFEAELRAREGSVSVDLGRHSCFGRCRRGPNVLVREILPTENMAMVRLMPTAGGRAVVYHGVRPDEAGEIIDEHIVGGRRLQHLIDRNAVTP
jgi:(2Fe-2S) ferredoxin